uniref:B30.2/SPRY domain-containing protein n=1 Tax=Lates calcarifer TaxID=8187 RepID=A0A4W6DMS7_LATCA
MRPELRVNTFISEMAAQFRQSAQQKASSSSSEQQAAKPGETIRPMMLFLWKRNMKERGLSWRKTEDETQQMTQKRRLKIQEIKRSVELSEEVADREIAEGVQVFTAVKESVERSQAEFIKTIKEQQRTTEKQAEDFIKELEQEISELEKRSSEVDFYFHTAPPTKDLTEVSIRPPSYAGSVMRALNQLEEMLSEQIKKLLEAQLKKVQQYAVDVTLDPDIVHLRPTQSNDACRCVLSEQGFTSGRFYFEVQVKKWVRWTVGVTRESSMKRQITLSPNNGYWTVCLLYAPADPLVYLHLKSRPEKVGVFVDYEEGLVSFYDANTAALIYSFTGCSFTDKLYPFFSPCPNDGLKIHPFGVLQWFSR